MPINDDVFEWMLKRNLKLHNITTARMRNISTFFRDTVLPDIGRQLQITNFAQITNRTAKLAKLRSVITSSIPFDDFQQDAFKFFTEAGNGEAVAFVNWMNQQLPLQVQMNVPAPNLIDAVINEKPFQGELMGDWFGKLKSPIQDGIYRDFRSGFIQGKTIPEMAKLVREGNIGAFAVGGTKKAIRDSKAVVRTGATAVTNRAREVTYTENSDIIKGVRYVATLDDRTTVVCASLHGKIFPISDGPRPPMHWQCRSTTVPEIMSWEEMGLDGKELSGRQMARFNGKPAVGFETDFGKFVDTMTEAQQNKFLGPVRAQMWRDGTVTRIEDFMATTTRMKPLSGFGLNRAGNPIGSVKPSVKSGITFNPNTFRGWDEIQPSEYTKKILDDAYISAIEERAGVAGVSPTEFYMELDDIVKDSLKDAEIRIRIDDRDLQNVLEEGRIKSQFETYKSKGVNNRQLRAGLEDDLFSYPSNLPDAERPVYGYLHNGEKILNNDQYLDGYGYNRVVLKKGIRKRTTVSGGDSLDNQNNLAQMPFDRADSKAISHDWQNNIYNKKILGSPDYWEAQIHGGLDIDQIEKVILDRDAKNLNILKDLLDDKNIPWEIAK